MNTNWHDYAIFSIRMSKIKNRNNGLLFASCIRPPWWCHFSRCFRLPSEIGWYCHLNQQETIRSFKITSLKFEKTWCSLKTIEQRLLLNLLYEHLLPDCRTLYPNNNYVFRRDGAPSHISQSGLFGWKHEAIYKKRWVSSTKHCL